MGKREFEFAHSEFSKDCNFHPRDYGGFWLVVGYDSMLGLHPSERLEKAAKRMGNSVSIDTRRMGNSVPNDTR